MKLLLIFLAAFFAQANEQYAQGNYEEAVSLYKQCEPSAEVYYNLGNALFKQGDLGHAILSYERSLRLDPRDKDCKHNLLFAQSQIIDNVEDNEFFLSSWAKVLRNQLPQGLWFLLSIIFWCLTLIGIVIFILSSVAGHPTPLLPYSPTLKRLAFHLSWIFLLFAILAGLNAFSLHRRDTLRSEAIITQGIVNCKASPDRSGTELFTLHEGTKVTIHESLGDWVNIHVGNNVGWLPAAYLERI